MVRKEFFFMEAPIVFVWFDKLTTNGIKIFYDPFALSVSKGANVSDLSLRRAVCRNQLLRKIKELRMDA